MRIQLPDARRLMTLWSAALWLFVGLEALLLLAARSMVVWVTEAPQWAEPWRRAVLGVSNGDAGLMRWTLAVNVLVVLAFWCAFRTARRAKGPRATAVEAASLAGAVVVGALAWAWTELGRVDASFHVVAILERGPEGVYLERTIPDGGSSRATEVRSPVAADP